ncbi:unnamed protein product [Rotaria sp. Silwood2]|nr:unnamed protein product [Rotaria sp. Silwood2]
METSFTTNFQKKLLTHLQLHVTIGSIAFGYLFHTINTINVISSVELRKIDPFVVAFETYIERLGTYDLLSYEPLSYDAILISIQISNTLPLTVNISSYMF